jgi:hypothetical protein
LLRIRDELRTNPKRGIDPAASSEQAFLEERIAKSVSSALVASSGEPDGVRVAHRPPEAAGWASFR